MFRNVYRKLLNICFYMLIFLIGICKRYLVTMEAYYHRVWCITSWNQDCPEKYQQPHIWKWYQSNGRKWRGTEESLDEGEKANLKLNIQKTKLIASCPITSWQISREKVEAVTDFIFLGSKIVVDNDCSHEIKRHSLEGKLKLWQIKTAY